MEIQFNDLTKEQLWQLRQEVVLNSLLTAHFRNSFHFAPRPTQDFFDGYVSFLEELASETGTKWTDQDSPEHLHQWLLCSDDYSWVEYDTVEN